MSIIVREILVIASAVAGVWTVLWVLRRAAAAVERGALRLPRFHRDWAMPTYRLARALLLALAAIVIFHYLPGAETKAFEAVALFVGFVISLGSRGAIGNLVAGVVLTYTRALQVGDRVRIGDIYGDVVERSLLVTHVRTIKNEDISIPNGSVLGREIVNYSSTIDRPGLILHTAVTLGYDVPWRLVHRLLVEAAVATSHVLAIPKPYVLQVGLEDFYARYEINAYTDRADLSARIYSDLRQNIQDALHGAGVEMLSPHYTAFRDGGARAVPAGSRPAVEAVGA